MKVRMIQELRKRMESQIKELKEMFNEELEYLKNKQIKINNTISEMKISLEGINSRVSEAEERISKVEDRVVEITATEKNEEKIINRNEDSLRDLWNNIKHTNLFLTGVPKKEEREKRSEKIFEEIIAKNFANMRKETIKRGNRQHRTGETQRGTQQDRY